MSFEYLKKKYPHLRQQINTYKEPDEFVYVNCQWEQNGETYTPVDDPNLQTIKINIQDLIERNAKFWSPENPPKGISKPKLDKIAGFGKFATDQYFEVPEPPDSLVDLEKNYFNYRHKPKDDDPEVVEYFWQVIYSNPTKYKDALDYIEKALYHIRYGYWFYNDGKPTYIDGWHYRHLCFWKQGTLETRDKKTGKKRKQDTPEFRERGQKSFFFYKWCMVDTTDSTGKDYGIRTCFGYVMPKTRRVGETANILTPALDISSMQGTYSSFAADSERTSRDIFKKKFIVAWDKQPPWLRPMNDSVRPVNFLNNSKPARKKRIFRDYLDSYVDYADKADRSFYDGAEVNGLALNDEGAKCFKKDTPIRMFDGSIKLIQDLVKGDELMGPDGLKRTVRVTTSGQEEMFDVLPKNSGFIKWGCNKSHILSLSKLWGNKTYNLTIDEYNNHPEKEELLLWKSIITGDDYSKVYQYSELTLEPKGVGTYYGVTIDGPDRLFMLQDYQVVHNTTATNILEGWSLMKPCMAPGGNTAIRKFALAAFPSTVEEMEAGGGDNFWKLCQQSNYYETSDMTGQTDSGLRLVFFPSYEGLEGFIDKHGRSVVENPTEEQAKFIGKDYGAKTYIERTIEALKNKKTIEASEELKSFKRKHPVMYFDCWTFKGENSGLDKEIMSNRIVELELKKEPVRKGNLFWKVKEAGGGSKLYNAEDYLNTFGKHDNPLTHEAKVVFKDDQYGRFEMSEIPYPHESNLKQRINDVWQCTSPLRIASADTFDFLTEGQFKKVDRDNTTKMSRGAGAVMLCQDRQKDKDTKDTTEWTSYKFVCDYLYRTKSSDIYCEEMLMMSIYWSCVMYPEINKPLVWQHFVDRGYGGFLLYEVDLKSGMLKDKPGFRTGTESKQDLFDGVRNYVSAHLHKEEQLRIIKDFQAIKGYDDMTNRDLFTAAAGCIRGHKHMQYQIPDKEEATSSIADYF